MEGDLISVDITALNDLGHWFYTDFLLRIHLLSPMPGTDICDEFARYRDAPQSRTLIPIVPPAHLPLTQEQVRAMLADAPKSYYVEEAGTVLCHSIVLSRLRLMIAICAKILHHDVCPTSLQLRRCISAQSRRMPVSGMQPRWVFSFMAGISLYEYLVVAARRGQSRGDRIDDRKRGRPKDTLPESTIYERFWCPDTLITRRLLGLEPNAHEEQPSSVASVVRPYLW